ncbi:MAG: hypothetical protein M3326_12135 [Actinomycetota bacterium]|nr:hypothetical protein [Actinomycetota bacterium]
MAELPEVWTEQTPAAEDAAPAPPTSEPPKHRRERGPFMTYLRLPWSYGDRDSGERWHRVQCRLGRHKTVGGYSMQVDSAMVFVEPRCVWCGAEPGWSATDSG